MAQGPAQLCRPNSVEFVGLVAHGDALRTTSNDPQIIIKFPEPKEPGWWEFSTRITTERIRNPKLYLDYGAGFSEQDSITLRRDEASGNWVAKFFVPKPLLLLRFDPTDMASVFRIEDLQIERQGKLALLHDFASRSTREFARAPQTFIKALPSYLAAYRSRGFMKLEQGTHEDALGPSYSEWLVMNDYWEERDLPAVKDQMSQFSHLPKISVVVPVYNSDPDYLSQMIRSVRQQVYPNWELCIADDCSSEPHVRAILKAAAGVEDRIKVKFRTSNGHIAEASNSAFSMATGDIVTLADHDDLMHPLALYHLAKASLENPGWRILFSDEDKIDAEGRRFDPYFKGKFNRDLFYGHNMITHLIAYRRSDMISVGGFRTGFDGSQDYDLALRILDLVTDDDRQVIHIPHVLYHWRAIEGSVALNADEKPYAHERARQALNEYFDRNEIAAQSVPSEANSTHCTMYTQNHNALISIVICTRDRVDLLRTCVESVLEKTTDRNFELVIVDNGSQEQATLDYLDGLAGSGAPVRVVRDDGPFNFSRINNLGVAAAAGEYICLLNNDTEVISPDWLGALRMHLSRDDVGVVGAKLLYPNGTIQHAGVGTGIGGYAAHPYIHEHDSTLMNVGKAQMTQEVSAVTGACLATKASLWREIGGLDEENFAVAYNDVDYCLHALRLGAKVIYEPKALLYHHESVSRGSDQDPDKIKRFEREKSNLREIWQDRVAHDPFINPNFDLDFASFELNLSAPSIVGRPVLDTSSDRRHDRVVALRVRA